MRRAHLVGMPGLARHPARAAGAELQHRFLRRRAGEDAVAARVMALQHVFRDLPGLLVEHRRSFDRVEAKRAQRLSLVAERVQVPVVTIVHEPLWRHVALEHLAVLPPLVTQVQAPACQHGGRQRAEVCRYHAARAHRQDPDASRDVFGRVLAAFEQALEALAQRRDHFAEHARLQVAEQAVHREQRLQLIGREPEAGQLPQLAVCNLGIESVGLLLPVEDDRRMHAVAQVFEVALERGARHAKFGHEILRAHVAAAAQQVLDLVKALGAFHGESL